MIVESCIFCSPGPEETILENREAYARYDKYPVSPGHLLIIPKRHFRSVFEATETELSALWNLVRVAKSYLDEEYSPDGYNIGINDGSVAGQTIMHLHIHLIPRYSGDMKNPRGGVRGVIPGKQQYQQTPEITLESNP
jgi:diadenosine tetraphosphate (Ap4A) HIT family hydrolase